jgi:putative endonuclease
MDTNFVILRCQCSSRLDPSISRGYGKRMKQPAVYIMSNRVRGSLYVGVTSNLIKRVWEHRTEATEGFTSQYHLHLLVYFELCAEMTAAIQREKILKKWSRDWKIQLIEKTNPAWTDLYSTLT